MTETLTLITGTLFMVIMTFVVVLFAYFIQRKLLRKERAYREIEQLLQKQELQSAYMLIEVQEKERRHVASEIHDNIGSLMATLKIYSDLVIGKAADSEVQRLNGKINDIIENVSDEIRKISHNLDSATLRNFGLETALVHLCEAIKNSGKIEVLSFIDIKSSLDGQRSLYIYRIVQELFTNTLKHSQASEVRFEISEIDSDISVIYHDNGVGIDPQAREGIGLNSIRSRIQHLNGDIKIQSSGLGTTFIIEIPASYEYQ